MQGQLFSFDYLNRAIKESPAWEVPTAEFEFFCAELSARYANVSAATLLNESQTEDELIAPVLKQLGWGESMLPQVNLSSVGREDVPDYLLFPDGAAKAKALLVSDDQRVRFGVALLEAKRWLRVLDRAENNAGTGAKRFDFGAPASQMLRYLSRADVASDRAVKWGILTNGAVWRLYWQDARSRAEDFFEIDLALALNITGINDLASAPNRLPDPNAPSSVDALKLFYLLFRRAAFLAQSWDAQARTLHLIARDEGRLYEDRVSKNLGQRVFDDVFPSLAAALLASDAQAQFDASGGATHAYLAELREGCLVLLYRLLFIFYAEDRRLLPILDTRYSPYSLSKLRDDVADARESGATLSKRVCGYWDRLSNLFDLIAQGDDEVGMPAYNGGLFERIRAPILARVRVPDAKLAPAIDALSRRVEELFKARINYRDLSVAHLGSIYERLLEYVLVHEQVDGERVLVARPASFARKSSGSYYTHDDLVRLVLEETVGLLAAEQHAVFDKRIAAFKKKAALKPSEWDALFEADPATQILELKICDPAMGSGHFLVALVDYLADRVLEATQKATETITKMPAAAHLVDDGRGWTSPVLTRISDIRRRIKAEAKIHGWALDERQLDDRHIVRRMLLKKVIFGVDKNVMAVELAKVALWLHTFTVGAPLSFLDHHLKCGDSLHGEKLITVRKGLNSFGTLFQEHTLTQLEIAAKSLDAVAELTDTSIAEAHESKALSDAAEAQLAPIHALLDFWRALRWLIPGWPTVKLNKIADDSVRLGLAELLSGRHNLTMVVEAGRIGAAPYAGNDALLAARLLHEQELSESNDVKAANKLLNAAKMLAKRERFFHWWTAFPTVWRVGRDPALAGFDGVIGNPPWDRIKLQQVEWFAERDSKIASQTRAADRKALIDWQAKYQTPLWRAFDEANHSAEAFARVVRESGEYPLLSGGDINLYSLFVERSEALLRPGGPAGGGLTGILTPSGISADKGASEFFRGISGTGRLGALFDFENRKVFFPDVHASFKFSFLQFGPVGRTFAQARCAFYLHHVDDIKDPARLIPLTPEDFLRLNPNTGAAPIFRNRQDALLTSQIYQANPVLVNRSSGVEVRSWPVRYLRMFDMTNDSALFLNAAALQKQGYKPATLNRWHKGKELAVPLYEGKMVQMYDHRASDIVLNTENLHRAAQQSTIADDEKVNPSRYPAPQYWVEAAQLPEPIGCAWELGFKEISAPTNMRTMIATMLPSAGFGNKVPILVANAAAQAEIRHLLLANLNSFAFDFVLRQKLHGQTINLFILEQLPLISLKTFERSIGRKKISTYLRDEVLALSYTAHDLAPLAISLGYVDANGKVKPPFVWNEADRVQRMARIDALFMHLYGLSPEDASYILSTFPIVREKDLKRFSSYRTCDLILAYMARIAAGALSHANIEL